MRTLTLLFCLCMVLLGLPSTSHATDVVQSWAQTYQNTDGEAPDIFTVDAKGSVYIASYVPFPGAGNVWLIRKVDSLGQLQWSQSFIATGEPVDMKADTNGNLFLTSFETTGPATEEVLTVKFLSNGDPGWVTTYSGGSGQSVYIDPSGNCFVGCSLPNGTSTEVLLLEYSNAGVLLGTNKVSVIAPGSSFFTPDGILVVNGTIPNTVVPEFALILSTGAVLVNESAPSTSTDTYSFTLGCDPNSYVYLAIQDENKGTTYSFTVRCYKPSGVGLWGSQPDNGIVEQISASDSAHAYVQALVGSGLVNYGYNGTGQRIMNVQAQSGPIAADGSRGLVSVTESATAYTYSEVNEDLQTLWSEPYTAGVPQGSKLAVINGTVYGLNQIIVGHSLATNFIKFVQGVGVTAVTPAVPSTLGGNSVGLLVQLNDVAPAAGLNVYFVSNSSALGLPTSMVIPVGKSSLTVVALTDPVDVSTTVSIAAEVNGGIRNTTVVLTPAVLYEFTFPDGVIGSVVGGQTITGTIHLTGPTALLAHTVTLSSNSAKATVPASVSVAAGATSATFVVHTTQVTANTSVMITAKMAGETVTGKLTITP